MRLRDIFDGSVISVHEKRIETTTLTIFVQAIWVDDDTRIEYGSVDFGLPFGYERIGDFEEEARHE